MMNYVLFSLLEELFEGTLC